MGWGSGYRLMNEIIHNLNCRNIPKEQRMVFYEILIPAMQNRDWDTEVDCIGEDDAYDETLKKLHPDWFKKD